MKKTKKDTKKTEPQVITKPDVKTAVKRARKPKVTKLLPDITENVDVVIKRYVIVDQTPILDIALDYFDEFEADWMINFDMAKYRELAPHNFLLVYNDLAALLIEKGEMIMKNMWGTWWLTKYDADNPLNKNKVLIDITREAMEKEAKEKTEAKNE